ncbi:uncharacterized protein LOC115765956 [Drosophila novamexicana]|uniref:uncharacterized protein LOC115765956 n=1 Tax=Drosophila novamexicana TaxID=47314 RepID=UPI0011E5B22E|nr:uncharacterized protein LOC115765956 [Drosophila novamexicana]
MKFLALLALLLIWQSSELGNALPNSEPMSAPLTTHNEDLKFSPRLLVTPVKDDVKPIRGTENPVRLARKLLLELKLYNLVDEVVQAKHIDDTFGKGLLFEMGNPLQANEVVQAWVDPPGELCKQLHVAQDLRNFYEAQISYRTLL